MFTLTYNPITEVITYNLYKGPKIILNFVKRCVIKPYEGFTIDKMYCEVTMINKSTLLRQGCPMFIQPVAIFHTDRAGCYNGSREPVAKFREPVAKDSLYEYK